MTRRSLEKARLGLGIDAWLTERAEKSDLVVVELGHGLRPLAQVQDFSGRKAYIGVEAAINKFHYGRAAGQVIGRLLATKTDENIFFMDQSIDQAHRSQEDTRTILPDGSADEVFFRNVVGDPILGSEEEVRKVFLEAARLVTDEGSVVISETITPYDPTEAQRLAEEAGLFVRAEILPDEAGWDDLQGLYTTEDNKRDWSGYPPTSYFLILSRAVPHQTDGVFAS